MVFSIKRNAIQALKAWKASEDRKPMVLKGARQVGKTWLMKEFGRSCYENFVYFNFDEEDEQIKRMLKLDPYLIDGIHHEPSPQQEEIIRYGSKYVVTSASLSGFVR